MTQDDLAQLSREELIRLILSQYQQNVALQEAIAQLKADNEALRLKLEKGKKSPTNSSNSSQPPSRDRLPSGASAAMDRLRVIPDMSASS